MSTKEPLVNTDNPLEFTSFTPTTSFDASIYPLREKKLVKKPKEQRRRKTKKNEIRRSLIFSVLKVVVLALYLELGFSLMRKGVLESEFTEEIVRISDDRSHYGRDVGEKVTILEDELMGFAKSINFLRCRGSNSNWRINQDGLMLKSRSVYKSVTEEVNVWGWPLQTGGLFGTGFSSSSFTVLSGRVTNWSEGRFGDSVREANISWGKTKWSTSVLQLDHSTWVLESRQEALSNNTSFEYEQTCVTADHNLYQITQEKEQRPFSEGEISTFMSQMLQVLAHMHKNSYFHRQLKPTISSRLLTLDWLAKLHLCLLENVAPVLELISDT
ncbi:hypothetical protein IGI04_032489 [Brassica rapa subsp. trilocularis]|uniref:Protein kinase domain-containing protein n=1 Tax=Brassica rapa subsp. trilocularis TaxID=1813537 RepID=A0ABQ7LWK9_BRACM|nr:hypothetical protein IGI04_032489 [Brassica rapa subsp. trilocularis]